MPVNFSNALDSATPNIPSYNPTQQSDSNYSMESALSSVTEVIKGFAEQRNAQKENAVVSEQADLALQKRQQLLEDESDLQSRINDERAKVNPNDRAGFDRIMGNIRKLEQQARQLRRDNSASILALQRSALAAYPQYTDSLLKVFKSSEELASDVMQEADKVQADKEDPFVQYQQSVETLSFKAGVSQDTARLMIQDEEQFKADDLKFKRASMQGQEAVPAALGKVNSIFKMAMHEVTLTSGKQTTPEGAKANSNITISRAREALTTYFTDLDAAGIRIPQAEMQLIQSEFNRRAQDLEQYAGFVQTSAEAARTVKNDPNAGTFAALAIAYKDDPILRARLKSDPKGFLKDYYEPLMKVVDGLRGADLSKLQAVAKAGGAEGAKAQTQLNALGKFALVEGGRALILRSKEGQELAQSYFELNASISNGTFDPKKIPVGSVSERLMYAATFRPGDENTPAATRAKEDLIQREYSTYIAPEYDGGVNTRERLIFQKDISGYLDSSPGFRQTLIAQAKTDMQAIIEAKEQFSGGLSLNNFNFVKLDPKSREPVFEGGTLGGKSAKNLDVLNINVRILARYWGKEATQEWLRGLMYKQPEEKFVPSDAQTRGSLLESGNIDLANRPVVRNSDGTISTVRSISIGTDKGEVLIPTVSPDGKILTDKQAIELYRRTGQHLGIFKTPEDATRYAEQLHNQQATMYGNRK